MLTLIKNRIHILLISDAVNNLRLLTNTLKSQNYVVCESLSLETALQAIQMEPPDLILLDMNMPEINDYDVCQQLKTSEATRHIPIIFISALNQSSDTVRAFELGGQDYITKPFQEQEVLTRIQNQLLIQQQQKRLIQQDQLLQTLQQEIQYRQEAETQCVLQQIVLYKAIQSQVKELERLNQLKDDFISTISHEIRTPITSMKMVIDLLTSMTVQERSLIDEISKFSDQTHKVVQYFKILQEECDRELALVEDLLNLQHIEAGTYTSQPVPVNLQYLIPHLVEPFESRTQNQQQTLQVNLAPDLRTLNLDSLVLSRTITELLSNACKYTPAGGAISISANLTQDITTTNLSNYLQLTVTNTGVEIAPEQLPHIFNKFYRIPNNDPWNHGGTGLGLSLVKKMVEQIDGTIEVDSTYNQTCFTVKLKIG